MCLAVPSKILEVHDNKGVVDFGGTRREVGLHLLDGVKVGDYVLLHAGFAIQKLDPEEAQKTLQVWDEMLRKSSDERKNAS